jgi:hypothetical protein
VGAAIGLEEVVACCWEQRVSAARVQRVLPDGHADLIMYDTGRIEVVGLHDQVALPVLPAGTHLRGIRFRPAAVAAAFGTPASLLCNRTVPADSVLSSKMARRLIDGDAIDMWIRAIKPNPRTCAAVKLPTSRSVDEVALALDQRETCAFNSLEARRTDRTSTGAAMATSARSPRAMFRCLTMNS